jgi:hypothetical protein
MRKLLIAGGVALAVTFAIIMWMRGAVVGVGYAIQGNDIVQVENRELLAKVAEMIRQAGGIRGVVLTVKPGVDVREPYVGSIPSKDKPIVAISGCRKPIKVLGLISFMRVEVDREWVTRVWGEEADKRVNGLMLSCLIYGMSSGNESVFTTAVSGLAGVTGGERVFGWEVSYE